MKRTAVLFMLLCLMPAALSIPVFAAETAEATETAEIEETSEGLEAAALRQPGMCGEDLYWSYDSGTLTISGNGDMDHYPDGDAPWLEWRTSIQQVIFTGNVTSVGEGAFTDYDDLEAVDFGSAMHTIGERAFKSCDDLTSITLPASFRRFGKESFMDCSNLTEIWCLGGMPSFNGNCVWNVYATIYYPTSNPWPLEPVLQLQQAFGNRIQFQMKNAETEPLSAEPVPSQTEAAGAVEVLPPDTTAPVLAAITEATEAPKATEPAPSQQTEAPAQPIPEEPETVPAETTEETTPEPAPQNPPRKHLGSMSGVLVCMILFAGVISFLLIGALLFRRRRY